jgi:hypothetical protein
MTQQLPPNLFVWRTMGILVFRRMGQPFKTRPSFEAFMVLDSWKILRRGREDEPRRGREDNPRRGRGGKPRHDRGGWRSHFQSTLGGKFFEISRQNHPRRLGCPRQLGAFIAPILLLEVVPRVGLGFVVRAAVNC